MDENKFFTHGRKSLTEKEEILLCRYFDNEVGWLSQRSAKKLLNRNAAAKDFYDSLANVRSVVAENQHAVEAGSADLWSRISDRIQAEEKAAFYLGNRRAEASRSAPIWEKFKTMQAVWGGLSGAAVTAAVLLVFTGSRAGTPVLPAVARNGADSPSSGFTQVSLGNQLSMGRNQNGSNNLGSGNLGSGNLGSGNFGSAEPVRTTALNGKGRSPIEVDWMRGNGPLKLIQNPGERTTIIWVKRRDKTLDAVASSRVKNTPGLTDGGVPSITSSNSDLSK